MQSVRVVQLAASPERFESEERHNEGCVEKAACGSGSMGNVEKTMENGRNDPRTFEAHTCEKSLDHSWIHLPKRDVVRCWRRQWRSEQRKRRSC